MEIENRTESIGMRVAPEFRKRLQALAKAMGGSERQAIEMCVRKSLPMFEAQFGTAPEVSAYAPLERVRVSSAPPPASPPLTVAQQAVGAAMKGLSPKPATAAPSAPSLPPAKAGRKGKAPPP